MDRLRTHDYQQMLDLVVAILDDRDPYPPWQLVIERLVSLLRATGGVFAEIRWDTTTTLIEGLAPARIGRLRLQSSFNRYIHQHPLVRHYATTADRSPLALSDVIDTPAWRRTDLYATARHTYGLANQLAVPLGGLDGAVRIIGIGRAGSEDFTERDKDMARRLQPVLISLDAHLCYVRRRHEPIIIASNDSNQIPDTTDRKLTPRELTVLISLSDGLTAGATARRLGISPHTVNRHLEHLYRKLGTRDRVSTVLRAQTLGLLPPEHPNHRNPGNPPWPPPLHGSTTGFSNSPPQS